MDTNRTLTTGQIADYCRVNYRTVIRWIKAGRMPAHQLPGRGDHRVEIRDFLQFLNDNQLPIPIEFLNQSHRVMIVDDDPAMAGSIQRVLRREGYETVIAPNGFQAGALLSTFTPQLVTLDLQMPGIDGLKVLSFIRSHAAFTGIKILVVSGMAISEIDKAIDAGADMGIQKPFDNQDFIDAVKELIGSN